jgi:hypothetical protein
MRKILIRKDANGENIDPVTFIDLQNTGGQVALNLAYGSKYRFTDDENEKTVTSVINKITPNKGYIKYNGTGSI